MRGNSYIFKVRFAQWFLDIYMHLLNDGIIIGGRADRFTMLFLWMPFTIVNAIHNFVNAIHKMPKKVNDFDAINR